MELAACAACVACVACAACVACVAWRGVEWRGEAERGVASRSPPTHRRNYTKISGHAICLTCYVLLLLKPTQRGVQLALSLVTSLHLTLRGIC